VLLRGFWFGVKQALAHDREFDVDISPTRLRRSMK
jgi:hypothetical protein